MPTEKTDKATEKTAKKEEEHPMFEISRKILLAAIGAAALAQDEMKDFVDKLVERGEIAEKDGKKLMKEMREKRHKRFGKLEEMSHKHIQEALDRMNVPSKKDMEALNAKITELTRKIEELKKANPDAGSH